ncbi:MAG: hypothetical protein A2939_01245 [Parcubacteria group bacterium RIFCSPLOWO2_01_FULL_48_18]|nr:MAG: hypothetical protein A2939_01245 [Parcubacteria group bacterium RIFCSPLOWO2_01_FULL_48_18]
MSVLCIKENARRPATVKKYYPFTHQPCPLLFMIMTFGGQMGGILLNTAITMIFPDRFLSSLENFLKQFL